jgi:predicted amidohydrolase YtcJ
VSTFEAVNKVTPIANLRWSLAHVGTVDTATITRLKAMGAAIALHPFQFLAGGRGGPPLRALVDSGIKLSAGSDSAQISTLNPWLVISYMVTGKALDGSLINAGQQLTRMEALRLYTAENGWFLKEEATLGTIEAGKLADLVVLSEDYLDPKQVPDDAIRKIKSALTVVDGQGRARRNDRSGRQVGRVLLCPSTLLRAPRAESRGVDPPDVSGVAR